MESRFNNFQEKRMAIFRELTKKAWTGDLKKELPELVKEIREKYNFTKDDDSFIRDHILVAMGLDPMGDVEFSEAIDLLEGPIEVKEPIVNKIGGVCRYCGEDFENKDCNTICDYEAQFYNRTEGPVIDNNKCLSCGKCISSCSFGAIADKIEFIPIIELLQDESLDVYAAIAPSIAGQFGDKVTLGQIRSALKLMGFKDMIEVAMFADILTIKEAYEFNDLVKDKDDFFITSCCCPVWINLVEKHYPDLLKKMSPSVSPMIVSGRVLKTFYPEAKVVFIGPCIAKKAEAKVPQLEGAIDYVLTYSELVEIFKALGLNLEDLPKEDKDQASFAGRIYARTGGVSFSVKTTVNRIAPKRLVKFKARKADGVLACKEVLDALTQGTIEANFVEGMGCKGGCVGGPRTNIDIDRATKIVNETGEDSLIMTPLDNMNVMKILEGLGLKQVEKIIAENKVSHLLAREKVELK